MSATVAILTPTHLPILITSRTLFECIINNYYKCYTPTCTTPCAIHLSRYEDTSEIMMTGAIFVTA